MGRELFVGEIIGPDILIILAIVMVLFGSAKIPKLARSLGQASHEFRKGLGEGVTDQLLTPPPAPPAVTAAPATPASTESGAPAPAEAAPPAAAGAPAAAEPATTVEPATVAETAPAPEIVPPAHTGPSGNGS